ncbi:hypothetical protein NMG60_11022677 [Bertholletia excelsa]
MGGGEKSLLSFSLHRLNHQNQRKGKKLQEEVIRLRDVPKGCVAIKVGRGDEKQRVVVPVMYLNHPLFVELLKEAEEEYGFDQKGAISIPCPVGEFRCVQGLIDRENHHQRRLHHHVGCFRV